MLFDYKLLGNLGWAGVSDIDRGSLFASVTGLRFGTGTLSANFQEGGRRASLKKQFKMSLTGSATRLPFSFNSHAGIPSTSEVFLVLSNESFM